MSETACGRGLGQISLSGDVETRTYVEIYFEASNRKKKSQQQKSNKRNVLGIRQSSVIQILFQDKRMF